MARELVEVMTKPVSANTQHLPGGRIIVALDRGIAAARAMRSLVIVCFGQLVLSSV